MMGRGCGADLASAGFIPDGFVWKGIVANELPNRGDGDGSGANEGHGEAGRGPVGSDCARAAVAIAVAISQTERTKEMMPRYMEILDRFSPCPISREAPRAPAE
jgi:hypothetical protein